MLRTKLDIVSKTNLSIFQLRSYNLSSFEIAMMINLTLKSTGTSDPNLFVSPTGVRKMRIRDGRKSLTGSKT